MLVFYTCVTHLQEKPNVVLKSDQLIKGQSRIFRFCPCLYYIKILGSVNPDLMRMEGTCGAFGSREKAGYQEHLMVEDISSLHANVCLIT